MKRVVAYCRYSSEKQRDGYSIEAQQRAITEYCTRNQMHINEWYIDEAKSGTNDNRPSFQKMIKDSKSKKFEAVVIHKLDRFSRDRYDSIIYRKKLKDNGVKIISVLENISDDNPEDLILLSVLESMAEYYSRNLSREVTKGMTVAAKKGQFTGGSVPYGYDLNKEIHMLEINENEAQVVKFIFESFINGVKMKEIANILTRKGVKSKQGKFFQAPIIRRILESETYLGVKLYNTYKRTQSKNEQKPLIRVENAHPSIISVEIFMKAQDKLEENKRNSSKYIDVREHHGHTYLLSGLVYCGYDGDKLTGKACKRYNRAKTEFKRYYYYACKHHLKVGDSCPLKELNENKLDSIVVGTILDHALSDENIKFYASEMIKLINNKKIKTDKVEIKHTPCEINKLIANLKAKEVKLLDLYLDGALEKSDYIYKKKNIESDIEGLNLELEETINKKDKPTELNIEVLELALKLFKKDIIQNVETVKRNIRSLVHKVIVTNENIEVYLNFPAEQIKSSRSVSLVDHIKLYTNIPTYLLNQSNLDIQFFLRQV